MPTRHVWRREADVTELVSTDQPGAVHPIWFSIPGEAVTTVVVAGRAEYKADSCPSPPQWLAFGKGVRCELNETAGFR